MAGAVELGAEVSIPAVVIAETVHSAATDAPVNRVLKAVGQLNVINDVVDDAIGGTAGQLLDKSGSTATVDAIVVATAVEAGGGIMFTGDPGDLCVLAAGHPEVIIEAL